MSRTQPTVAATEPSLKNDASQVPEDCPWHNTNWCEAAVKSGMQCVDDGTGAPSCASLWEALYNRS